MLLNIEGKSCPILLMGLFGLDETSPLFSDWTHRALAWHIRRRAQDGGEAPELAFVHRAYVAHERAARATPGQLSVTVHGWPWEDGEHPAVTWETVPEVAGWTVPSATQDQDGHPRPDSIIDPPQLLAVIGISHPVAGERVWERVLVEMLHSSALRGQNAYLSRTPLLAEGTTWTRLSLLTGALRKCVAEDIPLAETACRLLADMPFEEADAHVLNGGNVRYDNPGAVRRNRGCRMIQALRLTLLTLRRGRVPAQVLSTLALRGVVPQTDTDRLGAGLRALRHMSFLWVPALRSDSPAYHATSPGEARRVLGSAEAGAAMREALLRHYATAVREAGARGAA